MNRGYGTHRWCNRRRSHVHAALSISRHSVAVPIAIPLISMVGATVAITMDMPPIVTVGAVVAAYISLMPLKSIVAAAAASLTLAHAGITAVGLVVAGDCICAYVPGSVLIATCHSIKLLIAIKRLWFIMMKLTSAQTNAYYGSESIPVK